MRSELIAYFKTINLGTFSLSEELPRAESGTPLYLKNPKRIYVDKTVFNEEPLIDTLNGVDIHNKIQSVTVYFAADAKTLPNNYDAVVELMRAGKDINNTQGFTRRECTVDTSYEADNLVTELEFRYTKIT
jgi:biopolymer transport protein ExbD